MATTGGIIQVTPTPGVWTQLPDQACNMLIFERGGLDIATSGSPGNNYFHIGAEDPSFSLSTGGNANANSIWVRTDGEPVTFIWQT